MTGKERKNDEEVWKLFPRIRSGSTINMTSFIVSISAAF
jgi:hypothetical protein